MSKRPVILAPRWVKDPLWKAAKAVPSLDLNFARDKALGSLVTFTRASSGTYVDSAGVIQTATNDVPRFDHNPTTGESLGLLVEEQRTNLLLNSGTLSTQNVTVTAVAHTLSFTGTGTITLSGTSTAGPLVGTGTGESNRVSLTFTPTAGTLTLTVSGTVTNAQLEAGSFRTSYIPTTGATATRSADVASITGTNFSSWYRQDEGTMFTDTVNRETYPGTNVFPYIVQIDDGTSNNRISHDNSVLNSGYRYNLPCTSGGVSQGELNQFGFASGAARWASAFRTNDFALAINLSPSVISTRTSGTLPNVMTQLRIGSGFGKQFNGTIRRLTYWPTRLSDTTLQKITQ